MTLKHLKFAALSLSLGLMAISCEQDNLQEINNPEADITQKMIQKQGVLPTRTNEYRNQVPTINIEENLGDVFVKDAVEPSECGPTGFVDVQNKYVGQLVNDPYFDYDIYLTYSDLSLYISYFDQGEQYFGVNGEQTALVNKRTKDLRRFWDMPGEITVKGQHTATLEDRDKVAFGYQLFGYPEDISYLAADQLLAYNELSDQYPENPFFALDGFATSSDIILLGDGLHSMLAETGVDIDIVYSGVLAHEWAHQIQFDNMNEWYPEGAAADPAADTRYTELEADFIAAYYLTHKRGATYNWKRIEQFFDLFFQIGDCGFASDGHHGTPLQRMAAAELGYSLAASAQKNGHILSAQEAHEYFVSQIENIL